MHELTKIDESLEGFDRHFNHLPTDEIQEITLEYFNKTLMQHAWNFTDSRQVTKYGSDKHAGENMNLFIRKGFREDSAVGIIISRLPYPARNEYKYYKFGDWETFNKKFMAQFQGDRS